jgi:hypothetical protein
MKRRHLVIPVLLPVYFVGMVAAQAATTTVPGETTSTETTVTTGPPIDPAVPVTTVPEEAVQADWTYRYFIPTLLVLAAAVVVVTVVQYFLMVVKKRYRVVR